MKNREARSDGRSRAQSGSGSSAASAASASNGLDGDIKGNTDGSGRRPMVVIVGAGFGGLAAARSLAGVPVDVTVVDRLNYHLFQPLLYQVAMAGLSANEIAVPIRSILWRQQNVQVVLAEVVEIDLPQRRLVMSDGTWLSYDYLIVAAGARTNYYGHDDWIDVAPSLKDLDDALEVRRRVLLAFEAAERETDPVARRKLLTFVIVGRRSHGGRAGGCDRRPVARYPGARFPAHCRHGDTRRRRRDGAPVATAFSERLAASAATQLGELGVELRTGTAVTAIDDDGVHLGDEIIRRPPCCGPPACGQAR